MPVLHLTASKTDGYSPLSLQECRAYELILLNRAYELVADQDAQEEQERQGKDRPKGFETVFTVFSEVV